MIYAQEMDAIHLIYFRIISVEWAKFNENIASLNLFEVWTK